MSITTKWKNTFLEKLCRWLYLFNLNGNFGQLGTNEKGCAREFYFIDKMFKMALKWIKYSSYISFLQSYDILLIIFVYIIYSKLYKLIHGEHILKKR